MNRGSGLVVLGVLALFGGSTGVEARVFKSNADRSAVVSNSAQSMVVVAQFDLSGVASGAERKIEAAYIEWIVSGVDETSGASCELHRVTSPWTKTPAGVEGIAIEDMAIDNWDVAPTEVAKDTGAGYVRCDVLPLINEWLARPSVNHGVVLTLRHGGRSAMNGVPGELRLVVYYGFRP